MRITKGKRAVLILMSVLIALTSAPSAAMAKTVYEPDTIGITQEVPPFSAYDVEKNTGDYYEYYLKHNKDIRAVSAISLSAKEAEGLLQEEAGEQGVLLAEGSSTAKWAFTVPEPAVYQMNISYFPLNGTGKEIELSAKIDGSLPYQEMGSIRLPRLWKDAENENGGTIRQDAAGNDIRPPQIEAPRWNSRYISDPLGLYGEPYLIYLEQGTHTLTLGHVRETALIREVRLEVQKEPPSYEGYLEQRASVQKLESISISLEGEAAVEKSSSVLSPTYDASNAGMSPADPGHVRLNSIGKDTWSKYGQAITWVVPADLADGMYELQLRVKQSKNPNISTYRTLLVNGEIPFAEARNIAFPYQSDWYIKTFESGEERCLIHLKGGDKITLEATTGDAHELLLAVNQTVLELTALYRKIIIITGAAPDVYRDYSLEREIPELLDSFTTLKDKIIEISAMIKDLTGKASSQSAVLDQLAAIMNGFIQTPNMIPANLDSFKSNLDAMASIILTFNDQPLEIDTITLKTADAPDQKASPGFWADMSFGLRRFFASFNSANNDFSAQEAGVQKEITVWVNTGRDQAQVINRLITDSFTAETGIPVKLSLIQGDLTQGGNTLVQAVLAGKGPDIALMMPMDTPINLALRGAAADLSQFDLAGITDWFYPSAWIPFQYDDKVYAVPETQAYSMMYYRKDILHELGVEIPQTWDDFYYVVKQLQSRNLQIGIQDISSASPGLSLSTGIFDSFLFQAGGTYFNDTLTQTAFDTPQAYEAFEQWVNLYRSYGLDRDFDFMSRMRSGIMPLGIASHNFYALLASTAPEINGLWDFAPIPGTKREDGTIDRSTSGTITGSIMLESAVKRGVGDNAYRFLTWWAGADTQAQFGFEIESMLGVSARYFPANIEAFRQMGWSASEMAKLEEQWEWVRSVPQVPGGYMIGRSLSNALHKSIDDFMEPRRMLANYNKIMNEEIARKNKEFDKNR